MDIPVQLENKALTLQSLINLDQLIKSAVRIFPQRELNTRDVVYFPIARKVYATESGLEHVKPYTSFSIRDHRLRRLRVLVFFTIDIENQLQILLSLPVFNKILTEDDRLVEHLDLGIFSARLRKG